MPCTCAPGDHRVADAHRVVFFLAPRSKLEQSSCRLPAHPTATPPTAWCTLGATRLAGMPDKRRREHAACVIERWASRALVHEHVPPQMLHAVLMLKCVGLSDALGRPSLGRHIFGLHATLNSVIRCMRGGMRTSRRRC